MLIYKNSATYSKTNIVHKIIRTSLLIIITFFLITYNQKIYAATTSETSQSDNGQTVKITSVTTNNNVLTKGSTLNISAISNTDSDVQYNFFIYSDSQKKWTELFNGYSSPTPGNKTYTASVNSLSTGKYKIAVLAKKSGTTGVNNNSDLGNYDDCYYFDENVIPNVTINNSSTLSTNDDVNINVDASINGKIEYKVLTKKEGSSDWVDKTNGYSTPVDGSSPFNINLGKLSDPGNYSIGLYLKNLSDSNTDDYSDYYCLSQYINPPSSSVKIKDLQVDDLTLDQGTSIKVLANTDEKVQYRVFVNNTENNTYEDVSNGYSSPVDGNKYYTININKKFSYGKFKISVCVKKAGTQGVISSDNLGYYDDYSELERQVLPTINVQNTSLNLKEGDPLILNVSSPQLPKAQYRVFISSDSGVNWTDATNGYIAAVAGNIVYKLSINPPFKAGEYKILVLVKADGTDGMITDTGNLGKYDNYYYLTVDVQGSAPSSNIQYVQTHYNYTLQQVLDMEAKDSPMTQTSAGTWESASSDDILKYLDPSNYIYDDYGKYQFLRLNYCDGITADVLNSALKGKGLLENKGDVFLQAAKDNNISPIYLVCHALEETGNGTSQLATGITLNGKTVYNLFGIGAVDADPINAGAQRAYSEGWFSIDDAIKGGAKFVATSYINNSNYDQNTLYKMRWNPNTLWHQYATDVRWAFNEIYNLKSLYDLCPNAKLTFDIPVYK